MPCSLWHGKIVVHAGTAPGDRRALRSSDLAAVWPFSARILYFDSSLGVSRDVKLGVLPAAAPSHEAGRSVCAATCRRARSTFLVKPCPARRSQATQLAASLESQTVTRTSYCPPCLPGELTDSADRGRSRGAPFAPEGPSFLASSGDAPCGAVGGATYGDDLFHGPTHGCRRSSGPLETRPRCSVRGFDTSQVTLAPTLAR